MQTLGFQPLSLEEMNVQAIFNKCLETPNTTERSSSILFSETLGYDEKDEIQIFFDKKQLQANKQIIEYLYGQLQAVHSGKHKRERLSIEDFTTTYSGIRWSHSKAILLELLYLGCGETNITMPFLKKANDTTTINSALEPTLSPNDPNFSEWFKGYEAKMKKKSDGQEPADD